MPGMPCGVGWVADHFCEVGGSRSWRDVLPCRYGGGHAEVLRALTPGPTARTVQ